MAVLKLLTVLTCAMAFGQVLAVDETTCSRICLEQDCDNASIHYGKYCGVGHGGCEGEEPCDAADACCKKHDICVEKSGLLNANTCHAKFLFCLHKVEKSGKKGFSTKCPYELVIPTMRQGIQLAMAVTSAFTGLGEGEGDPTKPRVIKPKRDEL